MKKLRDYYTESENDSNLARLEALAEAFGKAFDDGIEELACTRKDFRLLVSWYTANGMANFIIFKPEQKKRYLWGIKILFE